MAQMTKSEKKKKEENDDNSQILLSMQNMKRDSFNIANEEDDRC